MRALNPQGRLESFFLRLESASEGILFLDYDGTLAPLQSSRRAPRPHRGIESQLRAIVAEGGTRLIIATGRPVSEAARLAGLPDGIEIWGSYGLERRFPSGRTARVGLPAQQRAWLAAVTAEIEAIGGAPHLERKPFGLAIHLGDASILAWGRIRDAVEGLAGESRALGFDAREFEGGIEILPRMSDKKFAVRTVLSESRFGAVGAYLGDDLMDEGAFREIDGRGIAVLVRGEFRDTAADLWLESPDEVVEFLRRWRDASPRRRALGRDRANRTAPRAEAAQR